MKKCKYPKCKDTATHYVLWAGGRAKSKVCKQHGEPMIARLKITEGRLADVVGLRKL